MINYSRERALEIIKTAHTAILASIGPSGVQVSEFPCENVGQDIYLLLPRTSDHLFNLEKDDKIALHTEKFDLTGKGQVLISEDQWPRISLVPKTGTSWYVLLKIVPGQIHVLRKEGWGPAETIDLNCLQ